MNVSFLYYSCTDFIGIVAGYDTCEVHWTEKSRQKQHLRRYFDMYCCGTVAYLYFNFNSRERLHFLNIPIRWFRYLAQGGSRLWSRVWPPCSSTELPPSLVRSAELYWPRKENQIKFFLPPELGVLIRDGSKPITMMTPWAKLTSVPIREA